MKGQRILLISSELWGPIFVSKHHYAKVLARENEVYYLNPVSIAWSFRNLFKLPLVIEHTHGLRVASYGNILPKMARLPYWLQSWVFKRTSRILHQRLGVEQFDIIWSFDFKRF